MCEFRPHYSHFLYQYSISKNYFLLLPREPAHLRTRWVALFVGPLREFAICLFYSRGVGLMMYTACHEELKKPLTFSLSAAVKKRAPR